MCTAGWGEEIIENLEIIKIILAGIVALQQTLTGTMGKNCRGTFLANIYNYHYATVREILW